jgi:aspartyl-tRNA(Asn)/glutamyl-tRNA(Gln) amidotransferase subunit B
MTYEPTIGLEIHAELKTKTKMFCSSLNDPNETHPNLNICPVCMGHPGTLPTINRDAIEKIITVGLALKGEIATVSQFDRKNYFYPDLPKGYQISQYKHPFVKDAELEIAPSTGEARRIHVERIHLEEDTGRLIHDRTRNVSIVDFNRAGIPLMELVTKPELHSAEETRLFAENLQMILQYLGASDANMEKGEMRIEANLSLSPTGSITLGTKVELKNINSFRFVEQAIAYEIERQTKLLEGEEKVIQETRGWDEERSVTVSQRLKEESQDYRYFPEPDLPPLRLDPAWVEELRSKLPELPQAKLRRFEEEYRIEGKLAKSIIREKTIAGFFEAAISELKEWLRSTGREPNDPQPLKLAANYLTTDLARLLSDTGKTIQQSKISPEDFAELITYIYEEKISSRTAKDVLLVMVSTGEDPSSIIDARKLWQISEGDELGNAADRVIAANPKAVADFQSGKISTLQFLVGQVMKEMRGANPEAVRKILEARLNFPEKT